MTQDWGASRPDYSSNMSIKTQQIVRSGQTRYVVSSSLLFASCSLQHGYYITGQIYAISNDIVVFELFCESATYELIEISYNRYENATELAAASRHSGCIGRTILPIACLGRAYGYGDAQIRWPCGLRLNSDEDYSYAIHVNVISDEGGDKFIRSSLACIEDSTAEESELLITNLIEYGEEYGA